MTTPENVFDMSDEDFLKTPMNMEALEQVTSTPEEDTNESAVPDADGSLPEATDSVAVEDTNADTVPVENTEDVIEEGATEGNPEEALDPADAPKTIDYEAFYNQVMAPFKANGKEIELRSTEEAITLMQKGANYTRKMQDIAPYRKVLKMLENNDLLDENKISYLIDVEKKNPEAIKKLLKDGNIDPFEIDMTEEPRYTEGSHKISDADMRFQSAIDELSSSDAGKNTLGILNSWDNASINALYSDPSGISAIHEQIQSGVYDRIKNEIDRAKIMGTIPSDMSFLEAYQTVGNAMLQQQQRQPVARGVAPTVRNTQTDARVKSASIPRQSPRTQHNTVNPLELSDEDFLKQVAGRL